MLTHQYIKNSRKLIKVVNELQYFKKEMLTQKKAAEICHISTGHFSRIFLKETGDSFTKYYSKQKINWSIELLNNTDLQISQISEDLGFSDTGYFIKIFKKYEGLTPSAYRRIIKNS